MMPSRQNEANGPTHLHPTTDDPTRYRVASELETWKLKDPIERVRVYLARNGLADSAFFEQIDEEAAKLGARVREECRTMPDPTPLSLFDHVYTEKNAIVDAERAQYAAYLDSFEEAAR